MKFAKAIAALALLFASTGTSAWAQRAPEAATTAAGNQTRTFYLTNTGQEQDANEILVALRNMLAPQDKIYLVRSQNAIIIGASADQLALAQRLIGELDRPKKVYRLTYTLTDSDNGKRVGVQHASMIVAGGQRTTLRQGSKVPVAVSNDKQGENSTQTQMTYVDIGMTFQASLDEFANGIRLQSKVEQSSVADGSTGLPDPVIRQTALEGTSFLTPGKPLVLGSLDLPGTTRHIEIEVEMEIVK